jgi:hypothetical protein
MRAALETHFKHEPEKTSRSRIKRGLRRPQYRQRALLDHRANHVEMLRH